MHRLLKSQLTRSKGPNGSVDVDRLMALVDQAYEQFDRDRTRTDRAAKLMVEEVENAKSREEEARRNRERQEAEAKVLRERERVADAASRAKSSFLAVMSHEIRTPMNAVLGLTSTLLESNLDVEQRKIVQTIHDSGDSLLAILNDILDYSKLEAGAMTLENITFTAQEVSEAALSIVGPRAKAKGLDIYQVNDWQLPQGLVGDVGRLKQVLINLASNAVKFTTAGSVAVTCRCIAIEGGKAVIEWRVTDTGIGIAPDRVDQLFNDFVQADCTINRRFGGSGLGLSICRKIVEQMNGQIGVASTGPSGTTMRFTVELPIAEAAPIAEPAASRMDGELEMYITELGRPLNVLIADDNPTNRLVASKMLQNLDVKIQMAADGVEAVSSIASFNSDVVLMDMRMPEMDGLQATRILRNRGFKRPIIAFTANAFKDDIEATKAAGMDAFVSKPVRKQVLLSTINKCLRSSKEPVESRAGGSHSNSDVVVSINACRKDLFSPEDFQALFEELGNDGMQEAFKAFNEEMRDRLQRLAGLDATKDAELIRSEAHTIKGSAATFGLRRCASIAARLESNAFKIDGSQMNQLLDEIRTSYFDAQSCKAWPIVA